MATRKSTTTKRKPQPRYEPEDIQEYRLDQVEDLLDEQAAELKKNWEDQARVEREARETLEKKLSSLDSKFVKLERYQWIERIVLSVGAAMGMAILSGALKIFGIK